MAKTFRKYAVLQNEDITPGTNQRAFNSDQNLHELLEDTSIVGEGERIIIRKIRITHHAVSAKSFAIVPLIIQTAGTLTDNNNESLKTIRDIVNNNCDDDFAVEFLRDHVMSKRAFNIGSAGTLDNELNYVVELPQKYRDLLNREIGTERLQSLHFGYVIQGSNGNIVESQVLYEVNFDIRQKNVIIR